MMVYLSGINRYPANLTSGLCKAGTITAKDANKITDFVQKGRNAKGTLNIHAQGTDNKTETTKKTDIFISVNRGW
jgi:hypothetical protein